MTLWVYIFLAVTALCLIVEFITVELVSVWFAIGGFVSLILAIFGLEWYITVPAFIVVSAVSMLFLRRLAIDRFNKKGIRTNAETAIGKEFFLKYDEEEGVFTIKVNGITYGVKSETDGELKDGGKVLVTGLEGNKYIVKEIE